VQLLTQPDIIVDCNSVLCVVSVAIRSNVTVSCVDSVAIRVNVAVYCVLLVWKYVAT
jgi:hypothetical protein